MDNTVTDGGALLSRNSMQILELIMIRFVDYGQPPSEQLRLRKSQGARKYLICYHFLPLFICTVKPVTLIMQTSVIYCILFYRDIRCAYHKMFILQKSIECFFRDEAGYENEASYRGCFLKSK